MTFDTLQKSEYSGRPIEFYKFANDDQEFLYTSSTEAVSYLGSDYEPLLEISRRAIAQSTSVDRADLQVTMPRAAGLVREFKRTPPTPYWLSLFAVHFGDSDVKQFSQWRVMDLSLRGRLAEFRLESIITSLNRQGLQKNFGALCSHFLYDGLGCPVKKALHTRAASVTAISGDTIAVTGLESFIDTWFEGGYVELSDGDRRDIVKSVQSTGVLTLIRSFSRLSLAVGDPVTVLDGCKHRHTEDCIGKFGDETNNGEAHGGFPYAGATNPFGVQQ